MRILHDALHRLTEANIDNPQLDARLLLAHALGLTREALLLRGDAVLTAAQQRDFDALIARRLAREPMSHILGMREFYGREFKVNRDVLDPRPDTETLIDAVLQQQPTTNNQQPITILDIGTGSGCIIITLLKEIAHARGVGLDISEDALRVAFVNKMHHGLEGRLDLIAGDMGDIFSKNSILSDQQFDIIVSNPPYIPTSEMTMLMPEVCDYEPHIALNGGKDGLDCYRQLAKSAGQLLRSHSDKISDECRGQMFLEVGAGQADDVVGIFNAESWQLHRVHTDLAGHKRCVTFNRK